MKFLERPKSDAEVKKLNWRKWGPYLSDRQWGTVREDYSRDGSAWEHISHDLSRSYAYRWGEDGIGGISDDEQIICFSFAFWNHQDPIIKERFFGLTGNQGNHGEDVKEYYYHLDNNPEHSYQKMLYKYPQSSFPYQTLIAENLHRGKEQTEFELIDTGIFDRDEYFNIYFEYIKSHPNCILIKLTIENKSSQTKPLDIIPQTWFRNTWSWSFPEELPEIKKFDPHCLLIKHPELGTYYLKSEQDAELIFCNNESNPHRVPLANTNSAFFKDGFNDYLTLNHQHAVNNDGPGTKAGFLMRTEIPAKSQREFRLILSSDPQDLNFSDFERTYQLRLAEHEKFFQDLQTQIQSPEDKNIHRQALSGLLWNKQFYYYDIKEWQDGDLFGPTSAPNRNNQRNREWIHLVNKEIISMPDKWEYPWYAAWDLAFQAISLSLVDPALAKKQLLLISSDFYMHPNGQLPAYEWSFSDVNPPIQAWAAWKVYKRDKRQNGGKGDRSFLERIFHRLTMNFIWWVNRKDTSGHNLFQGGFLGLDNIAVFDRSAPLPTGGHLSQSDATSWMAMYSLNLMRIALELAAENSSYQDVAAKFFHHFLLITEAMTNMAGSKIGLWNEEDQFYYDALHLPSGETIPLKVRSIVGLIPLFAVEVIDQEILDRSPKFLSEMNWFFENRPELANLVSRWNEPGRGSTKLLSLLRGHRMKRLLKRMLDPNEFLGEFGVRALSRHHLDHPFSLKIAGREYQVNYQPGESQTQMFGGNSNWRGPIWFPMNYLLIESLLRFHRYYSDDFLVECPTGSGQYLNLKQIANFLCNRISNLFRYDQNSQRPIYNQHPKLQANPDFAKEILFYEYFHAENGRGLGASHQTGWTSLIADLIQNPIK